MVDLVADIGGTHARFALCEGAPHQRPHLFDPAVLVCADYPSLPDAARAYLHALPGNPKPRRAALAIAGPVTGDHIAMTNRQWSFSTEDVRQALALERLAILNDYTAVALSLPYLGPTDIKPLGDFDHDSAHAHSRTMGIIAPGTGLGIGGLLRDGTVALPLSSEGGHCGFSPGDKIELEIARILLSRFGRVSQERLLSGPGLSNLYETLCIIRGCEIRPVSAKEIASHAVAGTDAVCREALERFCAILGSAAGDLALMLYADVIFVGGGIVPQIIDFVRGSSFRARFQSKGRFAQRMANIPTLAITYQHTGLLGAAVHLLGMK
ncbi:MAG TPA: glucokinase [Rhizomicrobium sp.]|jgi:glucokinase